MVSAFGSSYPARWDVAIAIPGDLSRVPTASPPRSEPQAPLKRPPQPARTKADLCRRPHFSGDAANPVPSTVKASRALSLSRETRSSALTTVGNDGSSSPHPSDLEVKR